MFSLLRSRQVLGRLIIYWILFTSLICVFWLVRGSWWTVYDYSLIDRFYKAWAGDEPSVQVDPSIAILNISDKTYRYWKKNYLDRSDLAIVTHLLAETGARSIFYDIIFPRPSTPESDSAFTESIRDAGNVYLPIGFDLSPTMRFFRWDSSLTHRNLRAQFQSYPQVSDPGEPYFGIWSIYQYDPFSQHIAGTGHISAPADPDGVYRHYAMIVRVDNFFLPTISLQIMMDKLGCTMKDVRINWGENLILPYVNDEGDSSRVVIPINKRGEVTILYPSDWAGFSKMMEVQTLLESWENESLRGNLEEYFSGNQVLIGDISVGISDLGTTPLEDNVPLVFLHAALLNSLMTGQFIAEVKTGSNTLVFLTFSVLLLLFSVQRFQWVFYTGIGCLVGFLLWFCWVEFQGYQWYPVFSLTISSTVLSVLIISIVQITTHQDQAFIRNAFSKYVPDGVVNQLVNKPELLRLGGEERELTILFSDLAGFTGISEKYPPSVLVTVLNEYLTAMTLILMNEKGTIDKYLGDAIMAEFGAPIYFDDHAERAVAAAIKMQKKLEYLNINWKGRELPMLSTRIGINTGKVIVGNMGSDQVFDYTVIGDPVNLASRLEGVNKRYQTSLIISESTYNQLDVTKFHIRLLDFVRVKGKQHPVRIYHVYGFADSPLPPAEMNFLNGYDLAMSTFLSGDFIKAKELIEDLIQIRPKDPGLLSLYVRVRQQIHHRSPEWNGAINLEEK